MNKMEKDEAELVQRLRSIEPQLPFDADAFAERVVAERSRRRNRRLVSACSVMAATLLVGLLWQASRDTAPQRVASESIAEGDTLSTEYVSLTEHTDKNIHSVLAELNQQREQLESLLNRIESAKATMAAIRKERHHHMLAVYRAELSESILVPDLGQFYIGMVNKPTN